MKYCCQNLDDFLDGDLTKEDAARFISEAQTCSECQEWIDFQSKLDRHLKSGWIQYEVSFPSDFTAEPVATGDREERRDGNKISTAMALLVAATVLIAVGGIFWAISKGFNAVPAQSESDVFAQNPRRQGAKNLSDKNEAADGKLDLANNLIPTAKAKVDFPSNYVGVRVDQSNDDFTLIHVYPTVPFREIPRERSESKPNTQSTNPQGQNHDPFINTF